MMHDDSGGVREEPVTGVMPRIRRNWRRHELQITLLLLGLLLFAVYFGSGMFISIAPGERGVLWRRFHGTVLDRYYSEGLHVIAPWDRMTIYNVRLQTVEQTFRTLTRDGLAVDVEVTARFHPSDKQLGRLHQKVGPDYVKSIVVPEVGNAVRLVVSDYRPDALYAAGIARIAEQILEHARKETRERFVILDDVLVRAIILPLPVAEAIHRKLQQEQASLEMKFRLAREEQEATRKAIEAGGIRKFNEIAAADLREGYLRLRGIEATLELARSQNAKVIVIGTGSSGGQPLIFDADMFGSASAGAAAPPVRR